MYDKDFSDIIALVLRDAAGKTRQWPGGGKRLKIEDFQSQVCGCAASANLICAERLRRNEEKNVSV